MTRRHRIAALLVVLTAVLAGCTAAPGDGTVASGGGTAASGWMSAAALDTTDVTDLPPVRETDAAPTRLAEGLAPPTNRWFSSLAFSADPLPVYPFPLAFAPSTSGFAVQLPPVAASATTVSASFSVGLPVDLGAADFVVSRYDPVSVTLEYSDASEPIATVTIAEGSPIVAVVMQRAATLAFGDSLTPVVDGTWQARVEDRTYGVRAPAASVDGSRLTVGAGGTVQIFAVPDDASVEAWSAAIDDPVTGVDISYEVTAETASTRLTYTGTDRTVLVPFSRRTAAADCDLGTFDTAYGPAPACRATALEWSVPSTPPAAAYDLAGLDAAEASDLASRAADDLDSTGTVPADTYFGGKGLARLASILALSRSLDDGALADRAADALIDAMTPWLDARACATAAERCFGYDDVLHLIVGRAVSFGSEEGNDHHFHYGYFLYAAAMLATERPDLVPTLRPVIDLLADDIAGGSGDGSLPSLRVFDPYVGHSWASGLSPFADGNNQESSSEAVAAWNGLALWGRATGDSALEARGEWLLSSEADAARAQWLAPTDLPAGYEHAIFSILWGGKRDYATWFSPDPSAILGIQLLPVGPIGLETLSGDPSGVADRVAEAGGAAAFDSTLGDYVLLYSALAGPEALASAEAVASQRTSWDDGLSSSAVWAWFAAVGLDQQRSGGG